MGATAAIIGAGAKIVGGISARNSANAAGAAAQGAAMFNASIIERDIGLLARQWFVRSDKNKQWRRKANSDARSDLMK